MSVVCCIEILVDFDFFSEIFVCFIIMEIQRHKWMRKAKFAANKVSFVRGSGTSTTDVFTANNQAVKNAVK